MSAQLPASKWSSESLRGCPKTAKISTKGGWSVCARTDRVCRMDAQQLLKHRFCWPAQDRDRACLPSAAPRIPPVFTASVSSRSVKSVLEPLVAPSPAVHRLSRRFVPSIPGQLGRLRIEGNSCWYGKRSAGPLRPSRGCSSYQARLIRIVPDGTEPGAAQNLPDWRVVGDQDIAAEPWA